MTYRDDREALQSRVRELEEDLGNARREGEEERGESSLAHLGDHPVRFRGSCR